MRFYSRNVRKPESIITEIKDGLKVVSRKRVCQFRDGICDTEDPGVIALLKKHPNKFRTDKPWPTNYWQDTKEGQKLLERGRELKIDVRHIRKEYLISLINLIEKEMGIINEQSAIAPGQEYREAVNKAKTLDIKTYGKKKDDLVKEIEEKEVIINATRS